MDGLLLRLLQSGRQDHRFWKLFASIRQELDRLFWCFPYQPWLGAPDDFQHDEVMEPFEGEGSTETQLWRPGSLSRFADRFGEEYIQLWAIEPTRDDPKALVAAFDKLPSRDQDNFIVEHSRFWLLYTDNICWEIYARKTRLLDTVQEALTRQRAAEIYRSQSDQRGAAFGAAGLSMVWSSLSGDTA